MDSKEIKDWEDHLDLYRFHRRVYHHPNENPRMQNGTSTISKMGDELDLVYLLEKATIINEKIFRNRILKNENHEVNLELKKWFAAAKGVSHISIEFYKKRFEYTEQNMLEKYFELRTAFIRQFKKLNKKEQKVHLISLLNDTSKLGRAKLIDISEGLPLYQLGLETNILLHQGVLSHSMYSTIVSASNFKKDFKYTRQFIDLKTKFLKEEYRIDAQSWANAHTSYRQLKLAESIEILSTHEFSTHYFQIASRLLTTQVYFDLYIEEKSYQFYLFNYFDSYEKWIYREKFRSEHTKKSYLRFIQICRTLIKSHSDVNFNPEKIQKLLKVESNIQAPNWIAERVDRIIELKKK